MSNCALRMVVASVLAFAAARAASAAPLKVACVGEQTTHSDQLQRAVEYPAMLQTAIGAGYDVQNFGDCCSTVLRGYPKQPETHPYLSGGHPPAFNESVSFAPDIVVIGSWGKHDTEIANALYAGTLDSAKFQADYEALVTTYLNLPRKPIVYVSTPVPIPKGAPLGPTTNVILPTVHAIAAKYNLPIVDLYPVFLNQPQLYKDDTHVSDIQGLHTIANTVLAAMTGQPASGSDGGLPGIGGGVDGGAVDLGGNAPSGGGMPGGMRSAHAAGCSVIVGGGAERGGVYFVLLVALLFLRAKRRSNARPSII